MILNRPQVFRQRDRWLTEEFHVPEFLPVELAAFSRSWRIPLQWRKNLFAEWSCWPCDRSSLPFRDDFLSTPFVHVVLIISLAWADSWFHAPLVWPFLSRHFPSRSAQVYPHSRSAHQSSGCIPEPIDRFHPCVNIQFVHFSFRDECRAISPGSRATAVWFLKKQIK